MEVNENQSHNYIYMYPSLFFISSFVRARFSYFFVDACRIRQEVVQAPSRPTSGLSEASPTTG